MKMLRSLRWLLIMCLTLTFLAVSMVQAAPAVVRAVLFYSPTCGHCHQVMTEDLPPLIEKYGDQLQVIGINVTEQQGQALFHAAAERYHLEQLGVPTLIVGDVVLVGSLEIPEKFPGLIEKYLAQGGVDWPDIPGLDEALAAAQLTPTATPAPTLTIVPAPTSTIVAVAAMPSPAPTQTAIAPELILSTEPLANLSARLARDPAGNALAIVVLLGMIFVVGYVVSTLWSGRSNGRLVYASRGWVIPALCLIGFIVAAYLSYVETAQVEAVCGPVGDCNTVQQSEYARLFGVIPIGLLGLIGYVLIVVAWITGRRGSGRLADLATAALFGMSLFGTLFSIYLTFLEPFVIGATCVWCLSSAVVMTALLWLTAASAWQALVRLRHPISI
jgi:uncharacterized membrane protein/thiol-disulfide isomerase/thioredoxin